VEEESKRVRLVVDFESAEALLEWFEDVRSFGGFGTVTEPGFELPAGIPPELDYSPQVPRTDVGVRRLDALDDRRVSSSRHFIVSSLRDGGKFLRVVETVTQEEIYVEGRHDS